MDVTELEEFARLVPPKRQRIVEMRRDAEAVLGCHSHYVQHASCISVLCAMREIAQSAALAARACRALPNGFDTDFCQSSVQELASIRLPQIQAGFPGIFLAGKEF